MHAGAGGSAMYARTLGFVDTPARTAVLQELLTNNPGVRFATPNAWYGNRPIYFSDPPYEAERNANFAWLKDPEGFAGMQSDFTGWALTPTQVTPVESRWSDPTLLPAHGSRLPQPYDVVGSYGCADPATGVLVWYDIHRDGSLTPNGNAPAIPPLPYSVYGPGTLTLGDGSTVTPHDPVGTPPASTTTPPSTPATTVTTTPTGDAHTTTTTPGGGSQVTTTPIEQALDDLTAKRFTISPPLVIAALVLFALLTRR